IIGIGVGDGPPLTQGHADQHASRVTRPADIPAEDRVRRVLEEYLTECRDNGRRPSVLTLAARLGLSNNTFRCPPPVPRGARARLRRSRAVTRSWPLATPGSAALTAP